MTAADRFWAKVDKEGPGGCWLWAAYVNPDGYGEFWPTTDRHVGAHRYSYELNVGPIPEGLHIDHLCRVRNCVNPAHLEPVTCRENLLRGDTFQAANAAKTHCPQGHPYDSTCRGRRICTTCGRARTVRYRQKLAQAAQAAANPPVTKVTA